jgi:2-isopropylmalate synthase
MIHTAAEGDGPVNALDMLEEGAGRDVPVLREFGCQIIKYGFNEREGTGARIRVLIQSTDGVDSWGTVGVSADIIEASWQALTDSIKYGFGKKKEKLNFFSREK